MVDSSLSSYLNIGESGTFAFQKAGKFQAFIGGNLDGIGYRLGDADTWRSMGPTLLFPAILVGFGTAMMRSLVWCYRSSWSSALFFAAFSIPLIVKISQFRAVARTIEAPEGASGQQLLS